MNRWTKMYGSLSHMIFASGLYCSLIALRCRLDGLGLSSALLLQRQADPLHSIRVADAGDQKLTPQAATF